MNEFSSLFCSFPPPLVAQAGADASQDLDEVVSLRADVINQSGPLPTQAANLAKYFRILT